MNADEKRMTNLVGAVGRAAAVGWRRKEAECWAEGGREGGGFYPRVAPASSGTHPTEEAATPVGPCWLHPPRHKRLAEYQQNCHCVLTKKPAIIQGPSETDDWMMGG